MRRAAAVLAPPPPAFDDTHEWGSDVEEERGYTGGEHLEAEEEEEGKERGKGEGGLIRNASDRGSRSRGGLSDPEDEFYIDVHTAPASNSDTTAWGVSGGRGAGGLPSPSKPGTLDPVP